METSERKTVITTVGTFDFIRQYDGKGYVCDQYNFRVDNIERYQNCISYLVRFYKNLFSDGEDYNIFSSHFFAHGDSTFCVGFPKESIE